MSDTIYSHDVMCDDFEYEGTLRVARDMHDGKGTSALWIHAAEGEAKTARLIDLDEVRKLRDALTAHIEAEREARL